MGKLEGLWLRLRGNLWFLPSVMTALAVGLSIATIVVDDWLIASGRSRELWFVFGVGAEGVRGVLSSIAGSIITVTGVVFSLTVVALQLASTQFTPRVLRTFIDDRANQIVLGVFIGTFTYSLLVLRFVRSESERAGAFVPSVSATMAMGLALVSVGCLIYFINHIAQSITASAVIDRLTRDAADAARRAFPREIGRPAAATPRLDDGVPPGELLVVRTQGHGYLQTVDEEALLKLAEFGPLVVRMEAQIGDFFNSGDALASVWVDAPTSANRIAALGRKVRSAFVLGIEPTGPQDVSLGITRLADVAVKALSPGINDPTTAAMCVDGIGEVLIVLGSREAPERVRETDGGQVRLIARRPEFEELADLAFAQVRHHGAGDPVIAQRLLEMIERVSARVTAPRRGALARQAAEVARAAADQLRDDGERARVRRVAQRVLSAVTTPSPPEAGAAHGARSAMR